MSFASIFTAIFVIANITSIYNLVMLGMSWLDENIGYGLNPWIAFPLAALVFLMTLAAPMIHRTLSSFGNKEQELEDMTRSFSEMRRVLREQQRLTGYRLD
jgi:hypothetical protein